MTTPNADSVQTNPLWDDNLIQFARLICEINATQDTLDFSALCESMDLNIADVDDLFERANYVWERAKAAQSDGSGS